MNKNKKKIKVRNIKKTSYERMRIKLRNTLTKDYRLRERFIIKKN